MQACTSGFLDMVPPLTPNITVLRTDKLIIDPALTQTLSCAPLLRNVEVQTLYCRMWESAAPQTLQALRSLPQSITWQPLNVRLNWPQARSTVLELCAALSSTLLAQAVSKLTLSDCNIEPPIAALRASFPNVLEFELYNCAESLASSFSEAIAAWPRLWSVSLLADSFAYSWDPELAAEQHLEAAACRAAELKAGQPFEVVLRLCRVDDAEISLRNALMASIRVAGGGIMMIMASWPLCGLKICPF